MASKQRETSGHGFSVVRSAAKKAKVDEQEDQQVSTTDVALDSLIDLSDVENQEQLQLSSVDYHLVVTRPGATTKVEFMEVEFYLQKEGFHEDPFTHGSEEQKVAGRWYFHRAPRRSEDSNRSLTSTTTWRGGSRKGLDLTIGSSDSEPAPTSLLRGGVLLRSIRVLGTKPKVVSGPSLLVDEVLSLSGAKEIGDLYNDRWNGDTSAFPSKDSGASPPSYSMYLIRKDAGSTKGASAIYNSPRIGLDLSHPGTTGPSIRPLHSRIRFLPRSYRYFREPHLLTANGRIQTFVGVLQHCATQLTESKRKSAKGEASSSKSPEEDFNDALKNPRLLSDICKTMGLKD
ncbi:hypothetical protein FA13DRAFT_1731905 [Coprinellus micaceus]|uniref:Uncharacterized protein n=1 Tax=Coprinellus micaceus TaxID=71717 RepID=A0A4Y7TDY5_COPMI|nr:hypothetical protein FA13DRAFT_1731905 [Coprinellus micaceus]